MLTVDSDDAYLGMTSMSPDSCIVLTERCTMTIISRDLVLVMSSTLLMLDYIIFQQKLRHILVPSFPPWNSPSEPLRGCLQGYCPQ